MTPNAYREDGKPLVKLSTMILLTSALLVTGFSVIASEFDDGYISSDHIVFNPLTFVYKSTNMSWNDARRLCATDETKPGLVIVTTAQSLESVSMGRGKYNEPLWIGLVSVSVENPEPMWITCEKYTADGNVTLLEGANSSYSSTKRCAASMPNRTWEWRDCGERHGFICGEDSLDVLPLSDAPVCGEEDNSLCPFFNVSCKRDGEKLCTIRALNMTNKGRYSVFKELLSWNDAATACKGGGQGVGLARIRNQEELHTLQDAIPDAVYPLWIGLYRSPDLNHSVWIDCSPLERTVDSKSRYGRCGAINQFLEFEWLQCAEKHSFMCENGENDFSKEFIMERYLPIGGYEDRRSCPDPEQPCLGACSIPRPPKLDDERVFPKGACFPANTRDETTSSTTENSFTSPQQMTTTNESNSTPSSRADTDTTTSDTTTSDTTTSDTTTSDTTPSDTTTTITTPPPVGNSTTPEISSTPFLTNIPTTVKQADEIYPSNNASCNTSCHCRCKCVKTVYLSPEEWLDLKQNKSRWISSILEELSPNQSSFSSKRRRLESAEDTRQSVATIGSLGIVVLVFTLTGILFLDLSSLVHDFTMLTRNLRHIFHR